MPIRIIRQDITRMDCDAIVNPTNEYMLPGGGLDAAIHDAAGEELFRYCSRLGELEIGEAKITPAFKLPSRYIIHTAGPTWYGGNDGEEAKLISCYAESMKLAIEHGCESIAFPLISSGLYGYPKDRVMRVAIDVISSFLTDYEMDVFIIVFDKTSYSISRKLFADVTEFVDNHYVDETLDEPDGIREDKYYNEYLEREEDLDCQMMCSMSYSMESEKPALRRRSRAEKAELMRMESEKGEADLASFLANMDRGFADTLFYYIDKKGISDVECYKRSNIGKQTFSKIKCNPDYRPSKITAVSFAIGLKLNIEETRHLLSTAGMCLSRSNRFDVIIEYFITTGRYGTIFDVNEVLYQFDQPLLGV